MAETTRQDMNFPNVELRTFPIDRFLSIHPPEVPKLSPIFLKCHFGAESQVEPTSSALLRNYSSSSRHLLLYESFDVNGKLWTAKACQRCVHKAMSNDPANCHV